MFKVRFPRWVLNVSLYLSRFRRIIHWLKSESTELVFYYVVSSWRWVSRFLLRTIWFFHQTRSSSFFDVLLIIFIENYLEKKSKIRLVPNSTIHSGKIKCHFTVTPQSAGHLRWILRWKENRKMRCASVLYWSGCEVILPNWPLCLLLFIWLFVLLLCYMSLEGERNCSLCCFLHTLF